MPIARFLALALFVFTGFNDCNAAAASKAAAGASGVDSAELADAQEKFAETMSGTVLVGSYTIDGKSGPPKADRYEIISVSKYDDQTWVFVAKYGELKMPPLKLPLAWAGDTPVIALDDFTIPLLGTFSCRVMFHNGRYAGTWQHGDAGGHMWGRIEKLKKPVKAPRPAGLRKP